MTPVAAERIIRKGPENYDYWTKIYLKEYEDDKSSAI